MRDETDAMACSNIEHKAGALVGKIGHNQTRIWLNGTPDFQEPVISFDLGASVGSALVLSLKNDRIVDVQKIAGLRNGFLAPTYSETMLRGVAPEGAVGVALAQAKSS